MRQKILRSVDFCSGGPVYLFVLFGWPILVSISWLSLSTLLVRLSFTGCSCSCPILPGPVWSSCSGGVCSGCSGPDLLFWLYCSGWLALAALPRLPCSGFMFWISSVSPVMAVLSWLSCSGCPVLLILVSMWYPVCHRYSVSLFSWFGYSVLSPFLKMAFLPLAVLSWTSFPGCPLKGTVSPV